MADAEHVALIKQGSHSWNQWRRDNPGIGPDLRVAHLRGATLRGMDLSGAMLSIAILHGADLENAVLSGANLGSTLLHNARNLTVEQLCSVKSLWLTELHERLSLAERDCPHLLERPASS